LKKTDKSVSETQTKQISFELALKRIQAVCFTNYCIGSLIFTVTLTQ